MFYNSEGERVCLRGLEDVDSPIDSGQDIHITLPGDTPRHLLVRTIKSEVEEIKTKRRTHYAVKKVEPYRKIFVDLQNFLPNPEKDYQETLAEVTFDDRLLDKPGYVILEDKFLVKSNNEPIISPRIKFDRLMQDGFWGSEIEANHPRFRFNYPSIQCSAIIGDTDINAPAFRVDSSITGDILAVEQEYLYEGAGQGTIKKIRTDLSRVNIQKAIALIFQDEFNPEITFEIVQNLGDPMLTFRGPVGELLNPSEASN